MWVRIFPSTVSTMQELFNQMGLMRWTEKGTLIRMCVLNLLKLIKKLIKHWTMLHATALPGGRLCQCVSVPSKPDALLSSLCLPAEFVQMMTAKWSLPAPFCPLLEEKRKRKKKIQMFYLPLGRKMFIYSYCFCIENNWMLNKISFCPQGKI